MPPSLHYRQGLRSNFLGAREPVSAVSDLVRPCFMAVSRKCSGLRKVSLSDDAKTIIGVSELPLYALAIGTQSVNSLYRCVTRSIRRCDPLRLASIRYAKCIRPFEKRTRVDAISSGNPSRARRSG